uniref:Uncharacterized protein n=1 Tax=Anopheles minimus TaxID=112268 RepID=A0A182WMR8_9DIPT
KFTFRTLRTPVCAALIQLFRALCAQLRDILLVLTKADTLPLLLGCGGYKRRREWPNQFPLL